MYKSDFGLKLRHGLTVGLECEFFLLDSKKALTVPDYSYPTDDFPLLVEARSIASNNLFDAVESLRQEYRRLDLLAKSKKQRLLVENWQPKSEGILKAILKARHDFSKEDEPEYSNYKQLAISALNETHYSSGIHISFKKEVTHRIWLSNEKGDSNYHTITRGEIFDFLPYLHALDKEFELDIKKSDRTPGFYGVKDDGRVEYRSLPSTLIQDSNFYHRLVRALS